MAAIVDEKHNTEKAVEEQSQVKKLNKLIELNEEQKQFIEECETEFPDRYTDDDLDFFNNKIKRDSCKKAPPIIENWWSRAPRKRNHSRDKQREEPNEKEHRYYKRFRRHYGRQSRFS